MRAFISIVLIFLFAPIYSHAQMKEVRGFVREGSRLLNEGEAEASLQKLQKADSLLPGHPSILRLLSVASAKAGKKDLVYRYLSGLQQVNASLELLNDDAFDYLQNEKRFLKLKIGFEAMNTTVSLSDTAFTLQDRILHPEGIAYRQDENAFYISSIHKGKVIRIREGQTSEISAPEMMAVSSLVMDDENQRLWVSTGAIDEWEGYTEDMRGKSKVLLIDLQDNEVMAVYSALDEEKHYFGDMAMQPGTNRVYISDSRHKALYMIDPDSERLNLVKEFENFISLQGLAFNDTGDVLFFADYRRGLFRMNMENGEVQAFNPSEEYSLMGIDGLYFYNNSLITIHNGIRPKRIMQYYLNEDMDAISSFRFLERANPVLEEPTLGVLVGDQFYYVANSPWPRYDQDGNIGPESIHPVPLIMKIDLNQN